MYIAFELADSEVVYSTSKIASKLTYFVVNKG